MRRTTTRSTKIHTRNPEPIRHARRCSITHPQAPRGGASAVGAGDADHRAGGGAAGVEEAARWLGVQVPARYAAGLAHRARVTYAHGAAFRQKLRRAGDEGRDTLYAFMRHWLAARLQADRPEWFARLPQDYVWGGVELTGVSPCRVSHMTLPSPDDEPLSVEARSLWASF
jgi:hypothetical protein